MPADNIVVSGLTAAGKTTHARILAEELGYDYVSGTGTLARLCGLVVDEENPPRWAEIASQVAERRHDGIDALLEAELLRLSHERVQQVFDVWALPWTNSEASLIRLWLESDVESRTMKCYVSQGSDPQNSLPDCQALIEKKDADNRALFLRTIGFDLFRDQHVFHVQLDNSRFITSPTRESADTGIAAFAPLVRAAVDVCRGDADEHRLRQLEHECQFGPRVVVKLDPVVSS